MAQTGNLAADLGEFIEIKRCDDHLRAIIGGTCQNPAPWIYNHRITVVLESVYIGPELTRSDDKSLIFNCPRAHQDLPMRLASRVGKGAGYRYHCGPQRAQLAVKLGKASNRSRR